MPVELFVNDAATTVATARTAVAAGTTETWTVASSAGFPGATNSGDPPTSFRVQDPAQPEEIILVTHVSDTTWTVVRGAEGTPTEHAAGFTVRSVFTAASVLAIARAIAVLSLRKDFGATGDGVTDDGPAIQAAFDAIPVSGGLLEVDPGHYVSNQPITPPFNRRVLVRGTHVPYYYAGDQDIVSSCKFVVGPAWTGTNDQGLIHCNVPGGGDVKGLAFQNIALSGAGRAASDGGVVHGIRFADQNRYNGEMSWRFTDCSIAGFTGSATVGRLHVSTWNGCYIHNNDRYGFEASGTNTWHDSKIINCYFFFNRLGGCLYNGGSDTGPGTSGFVYFTNCRFERSGQIFGNPMNNNPAPDPNWVADAAGIRMSRAQYFMFTGCSTDANTGPGFDVLAQAAGSSAWLNNLTFVSCFANRDGGGAQTTLSTGTESSGFRVQGFNSTDGNLPKEIHFVGCETATGGSSDTGGSTVISPAYGTSFQDAFFVDWALGRPTGVTQNMRYAGDLFGSAFMWNEAGVTKLRNRLGVDAEVGVGATAQTFWQDRTVGTAIANQGLNLPAALTELDATEQGTRTAMNGSDVGIQVQISVNMRTVAHTGAANSIVVSIRDTSNTANVLATVTISSGAVGSYVVRSNWANKPAWFTGDRTLAVYTSGGDGTDDFIFKNIQLRWKGGGA
jgi:hypothetical protein